MRVGKRGMLITDDRNSQTPWFQYPYNDHSSVSKYKTLSDCTTAQL